MALVVKKPPTDAEDIRDTGLIPGWEDHLEESWKPTPVFLYGEFQTEEPGKVSP